MSKGFRIIVILLLLGGMLAAGFPLTPEGAQPGFADSHPLQSARCFKIGDTSGLFSCWGNVPTRLHDFSLIKIVAHRLDLVAYPFGYLFIAFLALFLIFALILI